MFTTAVAEHWIKVYTLIETHLHTTLNNRFHTFDITWVINANVLDMSQISFTYRLVDNKQIRYIQIKSHIIPNVFRLYLKQFIETVSVRFEKGVSPYLYSTRFRTKFCLSIVVAPSKNFVLGLAQDWPLVINGWVFPWFHTV